MSFLAGLGLVAKGGFTAGMAGMGAKLGAEALPNMMKFAAKHIPAHAAKFEAVGANPVLKEGTSKALGGAVGVTSWLVAEQAYEKGPGLLMKGADLMNRANQDYVFRHTGR